MKLVEKKHCQKIVGPGVVLAQFFMFCHVVFNSVVLKPIQGPLQCFHSEMSGVAGVSNGDGDGSEWSQPSLSTGSYGIDAKFSKKTILVLN